MGGDLDASGTTNGTINSLASIETGDATADSDLTRKAVGLVFGGDQSSGDSATVGKNADLTGSAKITLVSDSSVTTGTATASSEAEGKNENKPGLIQSVEVENLNAGANIQITAGH